MSPKRKNKFRHNKKRNTAFLFEVLVKELTKASIRKDEQKKKQVVSVLKKHFSKGTVLHSELDVYRSLTETTGVSKEVAEKILAEAKRVYAMIPQQDIFSNQSALISDISKSVGGDVYANFVPNYKDLATIAQIFNSSGPLASRVLMEQRQVEIMSTPDDTEQEFKHISNLTYRSFTKKFNTEYSDKLHEEQRDLLNKFIYSFADNGLSLKVYLNEEIERLKSVVKESLSLIEIKSDPRMLTNAKSVLEILDTFGNKPLDESGVKRILKIQSLAREVTE